MEIKESLIRNILFRLIGAVILTFSIFKFEVNNHFFIIFGTFGFFMTITSRASFIISNGSLTISKGKIIDLIKKPTRIRLKEIQSVQFETSKISWQQIALSLVLERFKYKTPKVLSIHLINEDLVKLNLNNFNNADIDVLIQNLYKD